MTRDEGKDFLQDCLRKCGYDTDIDDLIFYTSGNKKAAANYQHDIISGSVDFSKARPTIRYVVKCFIYPEIYAAWLQESCRGSGRCNAYKNDLIAMERDPDCYHTETTLKKNTTVYWFRGLEGVEWFIREKLLKE